MKPHRIRTLVRLTFANPASAVYLVLVGASIGIAATEPLWAQNTEGSLIWVWPLLLTFPVSSFITAAGDAMWGAAVPTWVVIGGIVVGGLVQSLALGALLDTLRGRRHRLTPPHGG
jgi:hypothetical protein